MQPFRNCAGSLQISQLPKVANMSLEIIRIFVDAGKRNIRAQLQTMGRSLSAANSSGACFVPGALINLATRNRGPKPVTACVWAAFPAFRNISGSSQVTLVTVWYLQALCHDVVTLPSLGTCCSWPEWPKVFLFFSEISQMQENTTCACNHRRCAAA